MKGFAKKGTKRGQKGFTLVELLIVFTLLGVLAAIMIPNVAGLVAYGHASAAEAELSIIQTAVDTMMAKENVTTVNAVLAAAATANMTKFTCTVDATTVYLYNAANPNLGYVRFEMATGNYTMDQYGQVAQTLTGYE